MPKRIKVILKDVGEELMGGKQDMAVRVTSAVYRIEEVANEINLPMHTKTTLWNILSDLESLREEGRYG